MGRSINSFTSYVGHAEETIDDEKVTLPEKDLWVAVLCRAALDACNGPPNLNMKVPANVAHKSQYQFNRNQARHFFLAGGKHFREICEMAGRNPLYIQERIRKILLRKTVKDPNEKKEDLRKNISRAMRTTLQKQQKQ